MARPPRWIVVTAVLGALALGAAGAWFYLAQRQYLEQSAGANLLAIAQSKLNEIIAWRTGRLADAAVLQESPFFVRAVVRWRAGREPEIAADILTRLRSTRDNDGYADVRLVDRAGRVVLSTSGHRGALGADAAAALRAAFRDRLPTISDVHVSSDDSFPHLAVVAPLFASSGRGAEPIGAVVLVVDARRSLFRLVESWPSPSPSAEAVLARRDGDAVLFLSELRFQPGAALTLRIPLSRTDMPAVMAVLGTEGVVRGVDYRGVRVISALRAVPGMPWFLVAKVDVAEALAVWRTRVALVFALSLAVVLVAAVTAMAVGQRSATAHYRSLYEAEAALGASETRYHTLVEEAGDGFALLDAEGRYLDVNSARCRQLGYTRAELLSLSIMDVDPLFSPQRFAADFQSLLGRPPVTYESDHRRKDGTTFPVEVTLSVVRIGGVPQALSLARDITDRKRANQVQAQLVAILDATPGFVGFADAKDTHILYINPPGRRIVGVQAQEDVTQLKIADVHPEWTNKLLRDEGIPTAIRDGLWTGECAFLNRDGREIPVFMALLVHKSPSGEVERISTVSMDITERKRAEEALRESQAQFRIAQDMSPDAFTILHPIRDAQERVVDFTWVYENAAVARLNGTDPEAVVGKRLLELFPGHRGTAFLRAYQQVAESGEACEFEADYSGESMPTRTSFRIVVVPMAGDIAVLAQDITERKRAEEALRASEERYRTILATALDGFWLADMQGRFLEVNDAYCRMSGYSRQELLAMSITDLEATETRAETAARIERIGKHGSDRFDGRHRRKDGSVIDVDISVQFQPTEGGRFTCFLRDVTEQKNAERTLTYIMAAVESASDAIGISDAQGHHVYQNKASSDLFGYATAEEMEAAGGGRAVVKDPAVAAAMFDNIMRGRSWVGELEMVTKSGRVFQAFERADAVLDGAGKVQGLIGIVTDITERKRAEEALRESEERYRSIIEQLHDVYYRTDLDGLVTMMSPSAALVFGFPSTGEMIGRPIESLWQDPNQRAAFLAAMGERGFVRDYEVTAVRTDGTPLAVAVTIHWVRDASGVPDGVEGIIRDVTERKQAEAALRALALHLDSVREEEHTRIARQIHDELGQALTALRLDLTWVGRKIPKGNTALRRRIDAAVALTDETITVGQRIVEGLRPPILDDLGLVPALEWFAQHFAKRSGLRIEFDAGTEEPVVADQLAVTAFRIVQEALTNVARHAQATHARVRLGERDGALTIEIRDDGQGLPEEAIRSPRSFGIVGMRERAASHGGALAITTSPGAGTTVRVTFPLERRVAPRVPR